jgi:hypothetical protein
MIPVQMIRVGGGDDAIQVPVFRLPYVGGRDAFGAPGGFFTNKSGEYGVLVDASLSSEQVTSVATEEIRKNLSFLQKLVREQVEALKSATKSANAS